MQPSPSPSFHPRSIICPACGVLCRYAVENPWRPFCSARCKGVDFGAWASENFRIEVNPENDTNSASA